MNRIRVALLACLLAASAVPVRADGTIPDPANPCPQGQNCMMAPPEDEPEIWLDWLRGIFNF